MTSGIFHSIPIPSISVTREARQRRGIDDIDTLADSLRRLGQIHPIVITREHQLIAGERRLEAARRLGWTHISAQYQDEVDELTMFAIELEENLKRQDLPWQDRTRAIARYHELRASTEPEWSHEKTADAIGLVRQAVHRHIAVAKEMEITPSVAKAEKFSKAVGLTERAVARRKADEPIHIGTLSAHTSPILTGNFTEWAAAYSGPKFNLLHCDFPYGINAHKSVGQNSALEVEYDDSPDIYFHLLKTLAVHLDNFCAPSAHLIFWFSPNVYCQTWELLKFLDGFSFEEHPLIWQRGENEGIAPDPARRPRRVYEMAFFGWRGDRKIIRTKANSIVAPTERERHPHEKSERALTHFFEMCVDSNTRLLDPTCGSGAALRAAKGLGAGCVFGIEQDAEYARVARKSLDPVAN